MTRMTRLGAERGAFMGIGIGKRGMYKLRPYQSKLVRDVERAWKRSDNVMAVMPTGAGKTVALSDIVRKQKENVCVIAHRVELVTQLSSALAQEGVLHHIIAPNSTRTACRIEHRRQFRREFLDCKSSVTVASVDTLNARGYDAAHKAKNVELWIIDEAAHVVSGNKWAEAVGLFRNARGLGVTATPVRGDGKALGRDADGVFDTMVVGPSVSELIADSWLAQYKIVSQPSDIDVSAVRVTPMGDFDMRALRERAKESQIVGDIVGNYMRFANGKRGLTFATDVATAETIARRFNRRGIPARCLHAETPPRERQNAMYAFRAGDILQIVNVDLFGEGLDVPGVEVVSLARPTLSLGLHLQQVGRAMRPAPGKRHALIIDHVNNWCRHGLPDTPRKWSLSRTTPPVVHGAEGVGGYAGPRTLPPEVDGELEELDIGKPPPRPEPETPELIYARVLRATNSKRAANMAMKRAEALQ
jgi:superfamily II DNA or RNA helicase